MVVRGSLAVMKSKAVKLTSLNKGKQYGIDTGQSLVITVLVDFPLTMLDNDGLIFVDVGLILANCWSSPASTSDNVGISRDKVELTLSIVGLTLVNNSK